jgi:hypothetical protein
MVHFTWDGSKQDLEMFLLVNVLRAEHHGNCGPAEEAPGLISHSPLDGLWSLIAFGPLPES